MKQLFQPLLNYICQVIPINEKFDYSHKFANYANMFSKEGAL